MKRVVKASTDTDVQTVLDLAKEGRSWGDMAFLKGSVKDVWYTIVKTKGVMPDGTPARLMVSEYVGNYDTGLYFERDFFTNVNGLLGLLKTPVVVERESDGNIFLEGHTSYRGNDKSTNGSTRNNMKRVVKSSLDRYNSVNQMYQEAMDERSKQKAVRDQQERSYRAMVKEVKDAVEEYVKGVVESVTSADFVSILDVYASLGKYSNEFLPSVEVTVQYGENYVNDDNIPLKWTWRFKFNQYGGRLTEKGTEAAERETTSWSGLNATTADHIALLRQSVNALEALQSITDDDILSIVNERMPTYTDYVTQEVNPKPDPVSVNKLRLESLVGEDAYVGGSNARTSYFLGDYATYYKILRDTGKQFSVEEYSLYTGSKFYGGPTLRLVDSRRVSKDKFVGMIVNPPIVLTEDEMKSLLSKLTEQYNKETSE